MKCPRCGHEMTIDGHRKIDLYMCYECGYIEGRNCDQPKSDKATNYSRLHAMNFNETVAFISRGLGVEESKLASWLDSNIA